MAAPGAPSGAPGRGFSGVPLTAARGETSKKALTIEWDYPVHGPVTPSGEGTSSGPQRKALPAADAFRSIAGDDPRPLLVLREFATFDDPGNEKLSLRLYTESTVILSHWFHCVRLPHHVLEEDHPYHALFTAENGSPAQLFLATADGSAVEVFDYRTSRADLGDDMLAMLEQTYTFNPEKNCEQLVKLLPKFDVVDAEIARLKEELDQAIEDDGPRGNKARKVQSKLAKAQAEKASMLEQRSKLETVPLKVAKASGEKEG